MKFLFLIFLPISFLFSDISVNNQVLANVKGDIITALDLKKSLDFKLISEKVELTEKEKIDFYNNNWKDALNNLMLKIIVEKEASSKGLVIKNDEINGELISIFGNDYKVKIKKSGMRLADFKYMIRLNIIFDKIFLSKIYTQSQISMTPSCINKMYIDYINSENFSDTYKYRVISVKGAYEDVKNFRKGLNSDINLDDYVKDWNSNNESKASISNLIDVKKSLLSDKYLKLLSDLSPNSFSDIYDSQKIIFFEGVEKEQVPEFKDVEVFLQDNLNNINYYKYFNEFANELMNKYKTSIKYNNVAGRLFY